MPGEGATPAAQGGSALIGGLPMDDLVRIARRIASSAAQADGAAMGRLLNHLEKTQCEIAILAPERISSKQLPALRAEMQAAERDLEDAADRIMDAVDALLTDDAADLQAYRSAVSARVVEILEACIFRDIVGQRLKKALGVLEMLETRLGRLAEQVGVPDALAEETREERRSRELILNGPQLPGAAIRQSEIDRHFDRGGHST